MSNTSTNALNRQRSSFRQSVRNSFTMAYRGLIKIKRTPEIIN